MGYSLLRGEGEESVYSTSKDRQAGHLVVLLEAVQLEKMSRGGTVGKQCISVLR